MPKVISYETLNDILVLKLRTDFGHFGSSLCMYSRHLLGEDLDSLQLKELQQLELQLEGSLKHIKSRKVNFCIVYNT